MPARDAAALVDIIEAYNLIRTFLEGIDREAFQRDLLRQSAVARQIEIIGEVRSASRPISGPTIQTFRGERWPECATS